MTRSRLAVRLGAQRPAWWTAPRAATSAGADAVDLAATAGLDLDDWQRWVLEQALGERPDGKWQSFEVGLCVPRQNGKSALLEALMLASLFLDGGLTIYSAHEFKAAQELFYRLNGMIRSTPHLEQLVKRRVTSTNEMGLELHDGARLRFLARSGGSGRSFSADRLIFDEAMILPFASMGAMLPTISARPNPQVWYVGSAGMRESHFWRGVRDRGRAGAPRLAWFEWGCDPDVDPNDRDEWARANPGMGIRIDEEGIESERNALTSDPEAEREWKRERLGIWDEPAGLGGRIITSAAWDVGLDLTSTPDGVPVFGVDVDPERTWSSVTAVSRRADGLVHVEIVSNDDQLDHRPGTDWLLAEVLRLSERWPGATFCGDELALGPVATGLRRLGIEPRMLTGKEYGVACAGFLDAVNAGTLRHIGQPELDVAVAALRKRVMGEGFVWTHRGTSSITPAVGATVALHVLEVETGGEFQFFSGDLDDDDDEERD